MLQHAPRVIPLYHQVHHTLSTRILRGDYPPGSQLPSESELSRELSVSRVTIREALRALVEKKVVSKARGRGTFVADPLPAGPVVRTLTGNLEELYDERARISIAHVEIARVPVTREIRAILQLEDAESDVVRIKRARHVDGEAYAFTVNYLPVEIGREITADVLRTVPLVRVLEEKMDLDVATATETLGAAGADAEVGRQLAVPILSPVVHIRRVVFDGTGRPLQCIDSYYRSDKFRYVAELVRVRDNGRRSWFGRGRQTPGTMVKSA